MLIAGIILGVLILLYILCLRGRRKNPDLEALRGWSYAHRGLHKKGVPENSMAAFRLAVAKGYGIELDLHLLADGNVAVIHDSSLLRTTGQEGIIEDLSLKDLYKYPLEGTKETIPTLREVLQMCKGRVPLILEMKTHMGNTHKLCDAAFALLDEYEGDFCVESFDPMCVFWLKRRRPGVVRGQLTANYMRNKKLKSRVARWIATCNLSNWLTTPDFVAYEFEGRKTLSNFLTRHLWGVQGVSWTLKTQEEHDKAVSEGWIPIFEGYEP
ncbi:MAG: glycerophosphodiester phosphodiesterase [Oscillospiraceae bacterium]|nr:glycerophosphodiester phosphodiesterase [Oscillospiraceae bacterium]